MRKDIREALNDIRVEDGWTYRALEDESGVSYNSIFRFLQADQNMGIYNVEAIANVMGYELMLVKMED